MARHFWSYRRLLFQWIQLNSKHNVCTIKSSAACRFPERSLLSSLTPRVSRLRLWWLTGSKTTWRHFLLPNLRPQVSSPQNQNNCWTRHQVFGATVLWQPLPVQGLVAFSKSMAMHDLLRCWWVTLHPHWNHRWHGCTIIPIQQFGFVFKLTSFYRNARYFRINWD